jgi:hypothetical protein
MAFVDFSELSPKSWHFLNHREGAFVVARIDHDRDDVKTEPFVLGAYFRNSLDSKLWAFATLYMFTTTNSYAAYLLPIILKDGMEFSMAKAQCLVGPPCCAAALFMVIQEYYILSKYRRPCRTLRL